MPETTPSAAVLGLGLIGSLWARHLEEDNLLAAAWNRSPRPGFPRLVETPAAAATKAQVLIVCVTGPKEVESVLGALEETLDERHTLVQASTIDPSSAKAFETRVRATGARYLEAPFTGSKPGAEKRESVFYLGGREEALAAATPVLERLSKVRLPMGGVAQACAVKLSMNLLLAQQAQALCESLALARGLGLDEEKYWEALHANAARSGLTDLKEPRLRARDYKGPHFSLKHMHKDMRLALRAGETAGLGLPGTAAVQKQFAAAEEAGLAEADFAALYEVLANVKEV